MDVHSTHMRDLCAELKQKVQEEKQRRKALSKEEKSAFRSYRQQIHERIVAEQVNSRMEQEQELSNRRKAVRDALQEFADLTILTWDLRNPPSNIYEIEAAAELPNSMKKWMH